MQITKIFRPAHGALPHTGDPHSATWLPVSGDTMSDRAVLIEKRLNWSGTDDGECNGH